MSWRAHEGDPSIYAYPLTRDALRRLGAHPTVAAARRAVGTEEGELWPFERVTRPPRNRTIGLHPRAYRFPGPFCTTSGSVGFTWAANNRQAVASVTN